MLTLKIAWERILKLYTRALYLCIFFAGCSALTTQAHSQTLYEKYLGSSEQDQDVCGQQQARQGLSNRSLDEMRNDYRACIAQRREATRPKQPALSELYGELAAIWAGFDVCGAEGKMDPALAAYGKVRAQRDMQRGIANFNEAMMNDEIRKATREISPASRERCNRLAMKAAAEREMAAAEREKSERNQRASQDIPGYQYTPPTTVNCITVGSITRCW